jgi:acetyltransferase
MEMPALSSATVKTLKKHISAEASFSNPMDMVAGAGGREFEITLNAVKNDKRFDSIVTIVVPPITMDQIVVARSIRKGLEGTDKTLAACFMGVGLESDGMDYLREHGIPTYIFPEAIAKTLSSMHKYRELILHPRGKVRTFKVDEAKVETIVKRAESNGNDAIVGEDAINILRAYGIQAAPYRFAFSADEAARVASKLGFPVVMKINTPPILHKTEVGGVMVDLRTGKEVRKAFRDLKQRILDHGDEGEFSVALQNMITGGIETVMGMSTDPQFGPLIMFGLGGIYVEIMKDVSFRILPLTDQGARDMIRSLRSFPLLNGFRGAPSVNQDVIVETLQRLSQLVRDFLCFSEIDINPFIASPDKKLCAAVDARFIIKTLKS